MKRFALLPLISALVFAGSAQAHQVWLEQDAKTARLYFGEFGENLRETSPGLLDKFVKPTATLSNAKGEQPLTLTKAGKSFQLSARAGKNESLYAEEATYPVIEQKEGDKVKSRLIWTPAARLVTSSAAVEPKLTLDIVPTGKAGEFKVTYKGQPLPKTAVTIITQSGWGKEAHADEQGLVHFDTPWQGTYVLEAKHTDKTAGERAGQAYDTASYVTTLSLSQSTGAKPLPAAPAATPNK